MAVQAKYYAKPKVAPDGCKSYANKWHPGVITSISSPFLLLDPCVGILYDDDAREEGVLYSSLKALFAEPTPGAPAAAPPTAAASSAAASPAPASPTAAPLTSSSTSFATTVEECAELGV